MKGVELLYRESSFKDPELLDSLRGAEEGRRRKEGCLLLKHSDLNDTSQVHVMSNVISRTGSTLNNLSGQQR